MLGALRAHDDVLSDELDALREEAMVVGHVNALPSKMVFDFPIQGDDYLETFAQHFRIEVLNQSASSWSWWFGALRRFVAREGTSRVPRKHVERIGGDNVKLGQWVASLRDPERRGRLTETQITQLEALPDWSWDPHEDEFQKHLTALKELVKATGKAYVPKDYVAKDQKGETLRLWHGVRHVASSTTGAPFTQNVSNNFRHCLGGSGLLEEER